MSKAAAPCLSWGEGLGLDHRPVALRVLSDASWTGGDWPIPPLPEHLLPLLPAEDRALPMARSLAGPSCHVHRGARWRAFAGSRQWPRRATSRQETPES
jgi:hypothetical protein